MTDYLNSHSINPILTKKFETIGNGNKYRGFAKWCSGATSPLQDMMNLKIDAPARAILADLRKSHPNDTFRLADIKMWIRANADEIIEELKVTNRETLV